MPLGWKYKFGMQHAWFRSVLRFLGNETFIKKNKQGAVVAFVFIKGPYLAKQTINPLLIERGWTKETS